ncbi:glycoside hydrolase family 88/105 protein [Lutibacter flavus]|uniref:Unsaturated rhamnogalacturonyl hydrolase n=1 Tax=Lutibacter flavus TaxID=691689 RepID=A0A238V951_9FLAO|nr:glycoside hydrolase family 88 protein [Lutibacter flavus]SNR30962.1 unsaturated rhamnogalacturonyl hydrolase [Lutibacter flavus]
MNNYKKTIQVLVGLFFVLVAFSSCKEVKKDNQENQSVKELVVSDTLKWSERMMLSEIQRFPKASLLDFRETPKWSYTNGLVLSAASRVYEQTNNQKIYDYIYEYADEMIDSIGTINTYKLSNQNLDMIKSGDVLLYLYSKTNEERFLKAIETLNSQMETQPKTSDGGYWHKKIYPNQMWLDGLYMAEPFHTKYALDFVEDKDKAQKIFDDVVLQFDLIQKHSRDEKSGLLFHGWDESKEQRWANKETGNSQHFWSRGMGWYGMAMVDVLDFLPENHPGRERIITYLNQFAEAITAVQHETGLWYQVLDQGDREGNYLEATGTSMFTYAFAKGVRKGYLDKKYLAVAEKGYQGLLDNLISIEDNGVVNLNKCCGVAGLGGNPYRDGSFEYYMNEIIRSNDPKGTGPFIMASLELNR